LAPAKLDFVPFDIFTAARRYSAGEMSREEFEKIVNQTLVSDGPVVGRDSAGELVAHFPFALDAAMYLDMVTDRDSPEFNESESRRLAGSLAKLAALTDSETASLMAHFARWKLKTIQRCRSFLSGAESRASFETFVSRRPWPDSHKAAVKQLDRTRLEQFAAGLEHDDWSAVGVALAGLMSD
jgi:hypothetical protein